MTLPRPPSHNQSGAVEAGIVDREDGIDAGRLADQEILLAMIGRHMDEAGAGVGGDMVGGQEGAGAGEEAAEMVHRMAGDGAGEVGIPSASTRRFLAKAAESSFSIRLLPAISGTLRFRGNDWQGF